MKIHAPVSKIILLFSFVVTLPNHAFSVTNTDSLKNVLRTAKDPCEKIKLLCSVSENYGLSNADSAVSYARQAVSLLESCDNRRVVAQAFLALANAFDLAGDYAHAVEESLKALSIFEKESDKKAEANVLHRLGKITFHQSESSAKEVRKDFYKDALSYYRRALKIEEELDNLIGITNNTIEIGRTLFETGDDDSALLLLNKALQISEKNRKELPFLHNVAKSSYNISLVHIRQKNYPLAIRFLSNAVEVDSILNNKEGVAGIRIAELYLWMGDTRKSILLAKKNLDTAVRYGYELRVMQASDVLYKAYAAEEDFKEAFNYLLLQRNLADSLSNEEHVRNITKMEMKHDFDKQQELEKIQHESEKAQQRIIIYGVVAALGILLIFLIYGIITFRQKQKAARLIAEQKKEVEKQKLIVEEKNREVHDSITYARRIQNAILPPNEIFRDQFTDHFILYKPKDIVAGDFYFLDKTNDHCILAVADCTGHGVPGAMVSVVCHNALKRCIREYGLRDPGSILDKAREIVLEEFGKTNIISGEEETIKDGMDISLVAFAFRAENENGERKDSVEIESGERNSSLSHPALALKWAGANNPLWILRKDKTELEEIKPDKQPVGNHSIMKPFTTHEITVSPGDQLYIFSDGFADQFGGEKTKKFKSSSMKELLVSLKEKDMHVQKKILDDTFENWKTWPASDGEAREIEQIDDVCIIGVRI